MTETNATRPTHQGGAQSHSAQIDAAAAEKMLSMARSICRHGYLHRYVPAQPRWCRRIGDQIGLALSRQQEVHPLDLERLAFVFKNAQAQQKTKVINRKPTRGMALRLARALDKHGLEHWTSEDVSLMDAITWTTQGSA